MLPGTCYYIDIFDPFSAVLQLFKVHLGLGLGSGGRERQETVVFLLPLRTGPRDGL